MIDMNGVEIRKHAGFGDPTLVTVSGRVVGSRNYRGRRFTLVLSPSVDAYSSPQIFEVRSRRQRGNWDQDVSCTCVLKGSAQFLDDVKFDRDGKDVQVPPLALTLDLCEVYDETLEN
jgi:hypothetical protein